MSATTATRTRPARFEALEDAVGSRFAEAAAPIARRVGKHLVHVAAFVTLVLCRDHTVLALAAAAERAFGDSLAGLPALMLHTWATGYDGFWSAVLAMLPTTSA